MLKILKLFSQQQGGQKTWNNLEFNNLGKKNLEKSGILYKSHGKTWNFVQKLW